VQQINDTVYRFGNATQQQTNRLLPQEVRQEFLPGAVQELMQGCDIMQFLLNMGVPAPTE
jgi:hypothetical protein